MELSISQIVREYNQLLKQEAFIKKRKEELAKYIKEYSMKHGVKNDKGSYYIDDGEFYFGSQARKTVKINEEKAREFLGMKGLLEKVITIKEVIDETKIEELVNSGELSVEDIENIVDVKITYAIDVKEKKKE